MAFSSVELKQGVERGLSQKLAHSIDDVVALSGLGQTTIFAEIKQRRLLAHKCGRRTLILKDDLLKWLSTLPAVETESTST